MYKHRHLNLTITLSEAEVLSRFEELRSYLYAKGTGGEYSETQRRSIFFRMPSIRLLI